MPVLDALFVYGTLRDPDILGAVLGRDVDMLQFPQASAFGFATVHMPARAYPALVSCPHAHASGLLLCGLSRADRTALDAYEGEEYRLAPLTVAVDGQSRSALAYFPAIEVSPGATPWRLEDWSRNHKAQALASLATPAHRR